MNNRSSLLLSLTAVVFASASSARAQENTAPTFTRPRVVSAAQQSQPTTTPAPNAAQTPASPQRTPAQQTTTGTQPSPPSVQQGQGTPASQQGTVPTPTTPPPAQYQYVAPAVPLQPAHPLSLSKFKERAAEAQKLLKSRLTLTSASASPGFVTVAAFDADSSKIHTLSIPKQTLLTRGTDVVLTTAQGLNVRLQVIRPNYVNSAVVISDASTGRQLTPLVVEYPIEKFGSVREMAYYTSAHPALLSPEVTKHGQTYVRNMLDLAAQRLKAKGKTVSPELVDIAERLCVVEHVDHDRFRREDRRALYNEVYALYALNELDTYRYSVSTAGAGGMVQMIPSTYQMIRRIHPSVGLNPDFVAGMRNHGNALEAMLLYVQDTWNGLALNQEVLDAMAAKTATQADLVAAGYNSNPARLPAYLRRGGPSWRTLIPRETQMYLQIYSSLEGLVQFKNRGNASAQPAPLTQPAAPTQQR
ncbi:MAG TPA: hypothetical protein VKB12_20340 [Pyrinomonadaceae bacterium]|nr:hypothetical protein [Pyrinomonadaceae bacterium]